MTEWRHFPKDRPEDDRNYFVSWLDSSGRYSNPHLTFFSETENKFFSLETLNGLPVVVDIFIAVPDFPK